MRRLKKFVKEGAQRERDRTSAPTTIYIPQIVPESVLDRVDDFRDRRFLGRQPQPQPQTQRQSSNGPGASPSSTSYDTPTTTPETLRHLRDLIRTRYQLDTMIWSLRGVRGPDRPIVLEKMEKADAVLREIYEIVRAWQEHESSYDPTVWTPKEWRMAQAVKARIEMDGKRWWTNNPPWNDV